MSIQAELYTILKNNTDVNNLVNGRVYPIKKPQNGAIPYITYQTVNDTSKQCMGGATYQQDMRIQIDCWSLKYSEVLSIKEAVKSALVGFKSSNGIYTIDDYEAETALYRQIIDFKIKG